MGSAMVMLMLATVGDWSNVRAMHAGDAIVITTSTAAVTRAFVAADDRRLIVMNINAPTVALPVKKRIFTVATTRPDLIVSLIDRGISITDADIVVRQEGVFVGGKSVAGFGDLFEAIGRAEVGRIETAPRMHGSPTGAVGGAIGGGVLVYLLFGALSEKRCDDHCGAKTTLMIGSAIALPIAGAAWGSHVNGEIRSDLIYERP